MSYRIVFVVVEFMIKYFYRVGFFGFIVGLVIMVFFCWVLENRNFRE